MAHTAFCKNCNGRTYSRYYRSRRGKLYKGCRNCGEFRGYAYFNQRRY